MNRLTWWVLNRAHNSGAGLGSDNRRDLLLSLACVNPQRGLMTIGTPFYRGRYANRTQAFLSQLVYVCVFNGNRSVKKLKSSQNEQMVSGHCSSRPLRKAVNNVRIAITYFWMVPIWLLTFNNISGKHHVSEKNEYCIVRNNYWS